MSAARAALTVVGLTALAGGALWSCTDSSEPESPAPPPSPFEFRLEGPRPWNQTLYYATGDAVGLQAPYAPALLDEHGQFVVMGRDGEPFHIRSEPAPGPAELAVLWGVDARGSLAAVADGEPRVVTSPERAIVEFRAPPAEAGPDVLAILTDDGTFGAIATRDDDTGVDIAIFRMGDRKQGTSFRMLGRPRPWLVDEFTPGPCVVAVQAKGRQWMAVRADLSPGALLSLDAGAQPPATDGAAVTCEDPFALLLLGGELPIPAPRRVVDLHFRSRWEGVPPGRHVVRYSDGREHAVELTAGAEIRLGE